MFGLDFIDLKTFVANNTIARMINPHRRIEKMPPGKIPPIPEKNGKLAHSNIILSSFSYDWEEMLNISSRKINLKINK
jgi:hypothetical protein